MRLLLVSNRLPVNVLDESTLTLQESVGGLASGLRAYLDSVKEISAYDYVWAGWPGTAVKGRNKKHLISKLASEFKAHPIFLSEKSMESSTTASATGLSGLFFTISHPIRYTMRTTGQTINKLMKSSAVRS